MELLILSLEQANPEKPSLFNQIFGFKDEFQRAGLDLVVRRGVFLADDVDSFFFRSPKLRADAEARIGMGRNPQNPKLKQKIFGFDALVGNAIVSSLGIEFPVGCITIARNAQEGNQQIPIKKQILEHHRKNEK